MGYLVAAGELLAFMFAVVWILSIIFNPGVVDSNPIKLKLGYNNFCVGLDTQPAKSPGLILFVVCYFVCIRYAVTNMTRSFERRRAGNIAVTQFVGSVASDLLWMGGHFGLLACVGHRPLDEPRGPHGSILLLHRHSLVDDRRGNDAELTDHAARMCFLSYLQSHFLLPTDLLPLKLRIL